MLGLLPGSQGTVLAPSVGSLRKKLPLFAISGDLHPVMDLARITEIPGCPRVASPRAALQAESAFFEGPTKRAGRLTQRIEPVKLIDILVCVVTEDAVPLKVHLAITPLRVVMDHRKAIER